MDKIFTIDWAKLWIPTHSVAEMMLRGSFMYVGLFLLMRFVMKRQAGSFSLSDILLIVLIADAAQNALSKEYQSITEGLILVSTIVAWDFVIDWLAYKSRVFNKLLSPPPLLLVQEGKLLRQNLRRELITPEEIMSQLRQQGVGDLREVKRAYIEGDGQISVIKNDGATSGKKRKPPAG
jgi:uncharacterized membrane protein YcaP (DUF421 family)